ncbi:hypothetical protein AAG570_002208 [Ranatra chinensis]|uniref:ISXO2-like transposase domain-containing protein n=1 Tax=Ranatra chinensis TaxID=642074 RepID=A0ABD0Y6V8_9HEMI
MIYYLENHSESVGGPGMIVELEESKFGKRKNNKSHYEGRWVLGGIERGNGRTFLVVVTDKKPETLKDCIIQWVLPGTTVYTDCWNAKERLGKECYNYLTVNHALHFVDPSSGTNTVGLWERLKQSSLGFCRAKGTFQNYLGQHLFDRLVKSNNEDVYLRFLYIVRQIDWSTTTGGTKRKNEDSDSENSE